MPSKNERINHLEKQLQQFNVAKNEAKTLSAIYTNITNRINTLNELRAEIETISKELYYYDLIDYLGNVPVESLQLKQCGSILFDLEEASKKFEADSDSKYSETCNKIRNKVISMGIKRTEGYLKNERHSYEDLHSFLEKAGDDAREKIEIIYFRNRRKQNKSRIDACISEISKNYALSILGEMYMYERVFVSNPIEEYKKREFPTDYEEMNNFKKYIFEFLITIYRRIGSSATKEFIKKIKKQKMDEQASILRDIATKMAYKYFNFSDEDFISPGQSVEI